MGPLLPLALLLLQGAAAERIAWRGGLDAALEEARGEKLPILIAFNMDGEGANDSMVNEVYLDAKIVGRSRKFLCLAASKFDHETRKEGDRSVCTRFGAVTCEEHKGVEKDARRLFLGGRTMVNAPQHVFVAPSGELLFRREWLISVDGLAGLMARALKEAEIDPGAAAETLPAFDRQRWLESAKEKGVERQRDRLERLVALDHPDAQALMEEEFARTPGEGRVEVLRAMGEPGYERALPFLQKTAAGRDPLLRRHAIVSLELVGSEKAVDPLVEAAKKESDKGILKELLRAIAKLGPSRKDVADLVYRRAADSDARLRANALVAASDLDDVARARELARKALGDKSPDVRACAVYALGLIGEKADVPRLAKLEEKETDFKVKALFVGAKTLIETEGGMSPPQGYGIALLVFAGDDIPHDGTWPPPPWVGKF